MHTLLKSHSEDPMSNFVLADKIYTPSLTKTGISPRLRQKLLHMHVSSFGHVGLYTKAGLARLAERSGFLMTDHGYCVSLYVNDPNNLRLEFTVDHSEIEPIMADARSRAHADLKRWLAGDHTVNNDIRPR